VQRLVGGLEDTPNPARGLTDALLILHQREAQVIVAMLAEASAAGKASRSARSDSDGDED
jgi:hypothetical protein